MKMRYLFNGTAAIAVGLIAFSCSSDLELTDKDLRAHASEQLGVDVDPNQDWSMVSSAKAVFAVDETYGETYTVRVYSNDPVSEGKGIVLATGTVKNGDMVSLDFAYPKGLTQVMGSITNSKGYTSYMSAYINDGQVGFPFGAEVPDMATRAVTEKQDETGYDVAEVAQLKVPFTAAEIQAYLNAETTKEPTDANVADKYDDTGYKQSDDLYSLTEYWAAPQADRDKFHGTWPWDDAFISWVMTNHPTWVKATVDETYVVHFKITNTWNKLIDVLSTEAASGDARTVYVTGKWTIPAYQEQRVGGGALIVVCDGGEIVIPDGAQINFVNQGRLVVMPGGKISGNGLLAFANGSAEDGYGYNGGKIDVGTLNNNMGVFYNADTLKVNTLQGGGVGSVYINQGTMLVDHSATGSGSANTRIFNGCKFECANMLECRDMVLGPVSYLYAGRLKMSGSEDSTGDPSEIVMASNAMLDVAGDVSMNNTSMVGPSTGEYAIAQFGSVSYWNWTGEGQSPTGTIQAGYVINKIAISVDSEEDIDKDPWVTYNEYNWSPYVTMKHMMNGYVWNNSPFMGTKKTISARLVDKGSLDVVIPASKCTPGYNSKPYIPELESQIYSYAFEDLPLGDYDLNDCVLKVREKEDDADKLIVTLCAVGASNNIYMWLGDEKLFNGREAHAVMGGTAGAWINTNAPRNAESKDPKSIEIPKPDGFSFDMRESSVKVWISTSPDGGGRVDVATTGQDPHGVQIPYDWAWPTEWTCVKDAYSSFIDFAKDASTTDTSILQWYKSTPAAGKTVYLEIE